MAGYSVLASRYAHSLFSLAQEKGLTNEVEADLIGIKNAFHESADLRSFLKSPVININTKKAALEKAFGPHVSKLTLLFLDKLVEARREYYIAEVAEAFRDSFKKLNGVVTAKVITAAPMNDKIRAEVTRIVKDNKEFINASSIEIEEKIDPSLIGGIIINVGDKQIDASFSRMINEFKMAFSHNYYVKEF
jgi:F-type H+-transporting ATPase subunit delta